MMDTALRFATLLSFVFIVVQDVTGVCPVNHITPAIDMCSKGTFTGYSIFIDISTMPRDVSSCACTVSSEVIQTVLFTTMEAFATVRDCEFYTYSVQTPLSTSYTWTCQNPEGFEFTYEEIDPQTPWSVNMTKTQFGLLSAPSTDPNYCVVLAPTQALGPIRLDCGETTPFTILQSTSTSSTGSETRTTTSGQSTSPQQSSVTSISSKQTSTSSSTVTATKQSSESSSPNPTPTGGDNSDNTPTSTPTTIATTEENTTKPAAQERLESENTEVTDTGLGIIIGGIFAGVIMFFLIATACYFYNRRSKRQEDETDRASVVTSTTNLAGYPYRQQGGRYAYYLDTSSYTPDYLYVYPTRE